MPTLSCSTFATGARQLVVHEAFEMTSCSVGVVRLVEVDAEDDGHVGILHRRRHDDLAGAGQRGASPRPLSSPKPSRALEHDIDVELGPRQSDGIGLVEDRDARARRRRERRRRARPRRRSARTPSRASAGTRAGRSVGEIVDRDELELEPALVGGAERRSPYSAETVDCNSGRHGLPPLNVSSPIVARRPRAAIGTPPDPSCGQLPKPRTASGPMPPPSPAATLEASPRGRRNHGQDPDRDRWLALCG